MSDLSGNALGETRAGTFDEGLANGWRLLDNGPAIALRQAQVLLQAGMEPRALHLAAAAWRRLGNPGEAEQCELSAIKISFSIGSLDAAAVAGREGRADEARAIIETFLHEQPQNILALTMLAELDIDGWRLDPAEDSLRRVLERAPSYLRAIMLLAKCLSADGRIGEAKSIVREVLGRKPDNLTALQFLGKLYIEANDQAEAAAAYRRMLEVDASQTEAWIMLAQVLRMLGSGDESKKAFRTAIELDRNCGAAWWGLAYYFPSSITKVDAEAIGSARAETSTSSQDSSALSIALGIIAERHGDFAESFQHIAEGKRLRSSAQPYDAAAESAKTDALVQSLISELPSKSASGSTEGSPLFIVGMPRSGTTLLERILAGHSQIEACGELPLMPRLEEILRHKDDRRYPDRISAMKADELRELGNWYVERSWDYRKTDKPRFIDKLNFNWMRAGLIRLILPNARIIDLRRDALDCCWANFKMMFSEGHGASNDQRDIARFYRDYVKTIEAVDAASPGGILRVQYEELVDDVEGQTRRILEFLGLDYEPRCIDSHLSTAAVATPSSEQVRRPINRDSIGSAEPYRLWLGPMIEELGMRDARNLPG